MTAEISPGDVRASLLAGREIALFDVREEGVYAEAHPLFAASLPLGRIELEIFDRVPRLTTPIVAYDNGEGLALRAVRRLGALGYDNVSLLQGGLQGWKKSDGELFRDVNVPSKAFGELVAEHKKTPSVSAPALLALIGSNADVVVLDARPYEEYHTMNIPTGINVPGGELVYRAGAMAPRPETTVVVNCAGRTRSIIGAQSLINAGIGNKVFALNNGTIGWTLAGQALEQGGDRRFSQASQQDVVKAAARAALVAERAGVKIIDPVTLERFLQEPDRTTYRFDVRTPEEYAEGHLSGFRSAPGGQLVQETDVFAPVRGARIVLSDDDTARANMTGSWLAQMGWDVYVYTDGLDGVMLETGAWQPRLPLLPKIAFISPGELAGAVKGDRVSLFDLAPSQLYARGHIPGARFATRPDIAELVSAVPQGKRIVLTSRDGILARFAAADLRGRNIAALVLQGGTDGWTRAGHALTKEAPEFLSPPQDRYRRPYEGTDNPAQAMQAYLDWEFGLVGQLARDGTHGFKVI